MIGVGLCYSMDDDGKQISLQIKGLPAAACDLLKTYLRDEFVNVLVNDGCTTFVKLYRLTTFRFLSDRDHRMLHIDQVVWF